MQTKSLEDDFLDKLKDNEWMIKLAYLADVFALLNELNLQLQGPKMNCFTLWNRVDAFRKRLSIWEKKVHMADMTAFTLTNDLLAEDISLLDYIQPIVLEHIQQLIQKFQSYFPAEIDPRSFYLWVENPFLNITEPHSLTGAEHNQLLGKTRNINVFNKF